MCLAFIGRDCVDWQASLCAERETRSPAGNRRPTLGWINSAGDCPFMTHANHRTADHTIDPLFLERWSPRAYDGSALEEAELMSLLEAARWAPSSYNVQPWRFIYARRGTAGWEGLLGLLIPNNASWAGQAGALLLLASDTLMQPPGASEAKPSHSHSADAGAAWAQLALQATRLGLQAHGMVGFDLERARSELGIPDRFRIEMMIAVGRQGDKAILPEALQAREHPNTRNPVSHFGFEGRWQG
jgi:nitroreductase